MSDRNVLIQLAPDAGLMTTSHFQTTASASNDIYAVVSRYGAVFEPPRAHFAFDAVVGGPLSEVDEQLSRYGGAAALAADNAEAMAAELIRLPQITAAYVQPVPDVPVAPIDDRDLRLAPVVSMADAPLAAFPDFRTGQAYLGPPPGGIGAAAAWARAGGRGQGVRIVDIEGAWQLTHADLQPNGGLLSGVMYPDLNYRNHGTAVLGELCGTANNSGVTGICPDAQVAVISHGRTATTARFVHEVILDAAARLRPGDVILLEMHQPGPRFNFARRDDQLGFIAMEWWDANFLAIRSATDRGIIVVEAAGNGAENLDDPLYDRPHPGAPATWRNPFRGARDSGAVVVGAGAPPNGIFGPDRARLGFSNFGSRIDCQAWGRSVVTTGYGDLHPGWVPGTSTPRPGTPEDQWFSGAFSGTSSASPIVTGVLACLQGIVRAGGKVLTPTLARDLLRTTGTPQQNGPGAPAGQHIGSRPSIPAILASNRL